MKLKILVLVALLCCVLHSLEARPSSKKRNRRGKWKGKGKGKGKPSLPFKSSIPSRAPTVDDGDDTFLADAIKQYKCNPKKIGKIFREARKKALNFRWLKSRTNLKAAKSQK